MFYLINVECAVFSISLPASYTKADVIPACEIREIRQRAVRVRTEYKSKPEIQDEITKSSRYDEED